MNAYEIAKNLRTGDGLKAPFPLDEPAKLIEEMITLLCLASDTIYDEFGAGHPKTQSVNRSLAEIGIENWWLK